MLFQVGAVAADHPFDHGRQVREQVPAINHMNRLGGAAPGTVREGVRSGLRQQVHRAAGGHVQMIVP